MVGYPEVEFTLPEDKFRMARDSSGIGGSFWLEVPTFPNWTLDNFGCRARELFIVLHRGDFSSMHGGRACCGIISLGCGIGLAEDQTHV